MGDPIDHPTLLSQSQLESFRAQLTVKHEAAFLAPQFLELLTLLTRDLQIALGETERLRAGLQEVEAALADASLTGSDARVGVCRDVLARLRALRSNA